MPMIEFSDEDVKRGRILPPAWYLVKVTGCEEKLSKDGKSTNYNLSGVILKNMEQEDPDIAGTPTPRWSFNSKAPGFAIGLFKALGDDITKPGRRDLEAMVGMEVQVFIENDEYEGKIQNQINHKYRPAKYEAVTT